MTDKTVAEDGYQERDDCAALRARIEGLADHLAAYNPGHGDYTVAARLIRSAVLQERP